ncbi:MAG: ABC transporter substrate-binding protein, partial [Candidatus Latescibacteria bacterium]|nr:ABC transporter substrate-binding protein [Candidatus Latescibacterota bacterium]
MTRKFITLLIALTTWSCASPDPNRIQLILDWKAQMEHAGFFVAVHNGFYTEEGIEIEILEGNGAPTAARVVGNGT